MQGPHIRGGCGGTEVGVLGATSQVRGIEGYPAGCEGLRGLKALALRQDNALGPVGPATGGRLCLQS